MTRAHEHRIGGLHRATATGLEVLVLVCAFDLAACAHSPVEPWRCAAAVSVGPKGDTLGIAYYSPEPRVPVQCTP